MPAKVCLVKAMVFPAVMYWTIKKAECRRIDAFELWCWRRLLRVPWTARRSNQSILKEISPEYSLEGLMLKLKLQYFGYLMQRADSLERDPDAGQDWRQEKKGTREDETVGWHQRTWVWASSRRWWRTVEPRMLQPVGSHRVKHDWVTKQCNKWVTKCTKHFLCATPNSHKTLQQNCLQRRKLKRVCNLPKVTRFKPKHSGSIVPLFKNSMKSGVLCGNIWIT